MVTYRTRRILHKAGHVHSLHQLELAFLVDFSPACPQHLVHELFARLHLGDLVALELQLVT